MSTPIEQKAAERFPGNEWTHEATTAAFREAFLMGGRAAFRSIDPDRLAQVVEREMIDENFHHCGRVPEAWDVGTMGLDDFSPITEGSGDLIARAVIEHLLSEEKSNG